MAAIFYVSSLPQAPLPAGVSDKWAHSAAYLGLAVTIVRALAGGLPRRLSRGVIVAAIAITCAYGATDEWHQRFVPGRTADVDDLIADAIGACAGAAACWVWGIISAHGHARGPLRQ